MRFIVGVDLRGLSPGASDLAAWLQVQGQGHTFVATHVLEGGDDLGADLGFPSEAVHDRVMAALRDDVDRVGASVFEDVGIQQATVAEDGLAAAADLHEADGLLLGRRAPAEGPGLIRLGRVARRLLRDLPVPVIVVPPNLRREAVGPGPVLVAVDLTDSCLGAVRYGQALARSLGRELRLVHAVPPPRRQSAYVPADAWDDFADERQRRDAASAKTWAADHGLEGLARIVSHGEPGDVLTAVAAEERACLLVCGSRQLSVVERLFTSSVATELAARAGFPVAVVPPDWKA